MSKEPTKKDIARWDKVRDVTERLQEILYDADIIEDYEQAEICGIILGQLLHGTINTKGVEEASEILGWFLNELHGEVDVRIDDDIPVIFNMHASIKEDTGE